MKIARVLHEGAARAAVVEEDRVHVLASEVDVPALLAADPNDRQRLSARVSVERPLTDVRLLAPVVPPTSRSCTLEEDNSQFLPKRAYLYPLLVLLRSHYRRRITPADFRPLLRHISHIDLLAAAEAV
jgi:hypothetical protein